MPILTIQDMEQMAPIFKGKWGNALAKEVLRFTGAQKAIDLHERVYHGQDGPTFAHDLLQDLGIDYLIGHAERLAEMLNGPFITISNHIYGHIDGIMLVDMVGHIRPSVKVMVNEILMYIKGLVPNFIAVNPTGKEREAATSTSIQGIKLSIDQIRSGEPLSLFPSGAVSDLKVFEHFNIRDRDWQDPIIRLIAKLKVPVIPIRFFDRNSNFYYSLGLIHSGVRQTRLCHEVFNKAGKTIRLGIGKPISVEEQAQYRDDPAAFKAFLRSSVYDMPLPAPEDFTRRSELTFPQ